MNDKIKHLMTTLEISEAEAQELLISDKSVDRMTSIKEINSDLTEEQKKVNKEMRKADKKPTVYQFKKKERKENAEKQAIISRLAGMCENAEITNKEREFFFTENGIRYKVVLSVPRK